MAMPSDALLDASDEPKDPDELKEPVYKALLLTGPPIFSRTTPITLFFNAAGTHLTVGDAVLPTRHLTLSPGLRRHELVLTTRKLVLSILPAPSHASSYARLRAALRLAQLSPPGYRLLAEIGHGAFGVVYTAVCRRTGARRAVKIVCKAHLKRAHVPLHVARRELVIARRLAAHPSIVFVHDVQETPAYFVVVMDLARGGSLLEYAADRALSPEVIGHIMLQLLNAVAHLHHHGVIHRDVKLENVLVKDASAEWPEIILVDLGLAIDDAAEHGKLLTTRVGTDYAQAPEMLRATRRAGYGPGVDVWACGIVLFALLYGRLPWLGDRKLQLEQMDAMMAWSRRSKSSIHVIQDLDERLSTPRDLHSLLCGLMQPDPDRRLTARAALEHALFLRLRARQGVDIPKAEVAVQSRSPRSLKRATLNVLAMIRAVEQLQKKAFAESCRFDSVEGENRDGVENVAAPISNRFVSPEEGVAR